MATYFVSSSGNNTTGADWTNAYTSLQTALTAASSGSDIVVIQKDAVPTGDAEASGNVTYTTTNHVSIVSATNDGGSAYTLSAMGETYWIGNSTTARSLIFDGGADDKIYMYGLTFRGTGANTLRILNAVSGVDIVMEDCTLWSGTGLITCGTGLCSVTLINPLLRFSGTGSGVRWGGSVDAIGLSISASSTIPTTFIQDATVSAGTVRFVGCDISPITTTVVSGAFSYERQFVFDRCKIPASGTLLAAQTSNPTRASASVTVLDCDSGDAHGIFGYYYAFGSAVTDSTIYRTAGVAGQSWKITTTANASFTHPFRTPWINQYNEGTSEITPFLSVLRDGSTTPYTNAEVWPEIQYKGTSGSTKATLVSGRQTIAANFAGTTAADWSADGAYTDWTGGTVADDVVKLDAGAITPAEVGDISMRVCVGLPSIAGVLIVDPEIRT